MNNSYKKDILKNIIGSKGVVLGNPAANDMIQFQFSTSHATAYANTRRGALTFVAAEDGTAAIYVNDANGGKLVSSAIQKVEQAAATGNKHGGKTITVTYLANGVVTSHNFNVIDEAGLEAYFTGSKTIALDSSNLYEVKVKNDGGIKVDTNGAGLYVDINDLFGVDSSTIGFNSDNKLKSLVKIAYAASGIAEKPAIQLQDAQGRAMTEVEVEDIIGSGIVESTSYNATTGILSITWKGDPQVVTEIDLKAVLDVLNDVSVAQDSSNLLTITTDASTAQFGTTAKLRNAVALAESAIQGFSKATSVENYVDLTVAAGSDPSTFTVAIDDTDLNVALTNIDASITRLDSSVSGIETAIAAMDADVSTAVALDAANGIYVRGTLTEADGVVTAIGLTTQIGTTAATRYVKEDTTQEIIGVDPKFTISTAGLATTTDVSNLSNYINDKVQKLSDELNAGVESLDASIHVTDGNFISVGFKQENGLAKDEWINTSYGTYDYTAATHTFGTPTNGIAKVVDTQTLVQNVVESLDLTTDSADSSAADTKNYIKSIITETDGIVKNESLTTTYGNYSTYTAGVATVEDTSAFVQACLTWTILNA